MRWSQQCAVLQETLPRMPFKLVLEKNGYMQRCLRLTRFVSEQSWLNYHTIQHGRSVVSRLLLLLLWACQSSLMDHSPEVSSLMSLFQTPSRKGYLQEPLPSLTC